MKHDNLIYQHEVICNQIIAAFIEKQDIEFDGWVGNQIGGVASFLDQHHFNIDDIILDLKSKQKAGEIIKWDDENCVAYHYDKQTINYNSYLMGARV